MSFGNWYQTLLTKANTYAIIRSVKQTERITKMTETRAKVGGQYGKNGEWYEGGQFLPSSETTEKGQNSRAKVAGQDKPRKQEIAPYKWVISEKTAIWPKVGVGAYTKFTKTGYSKENGAEGYLETVETTNFWMTTPAEMQNEIRELVNRWNNGERWM